MESAGFIVPPGPRRHDWLEMRCMRQVRAPKSGRTADGSESFVARSD